MSKNEMKPKVFFDIHDAIERYKDDPFVKCLADEEVVQIRSNTIHSEKYMQYPEPWIWAYTTDPQSTKSILLYAPGHFNVKEGVTAEIIEEGGEE